MKNYSYKPTDNNALHLLEANRIGRKQDILRFLTLLSNMEDDCYSIAINGEWGSGKTFFIKQVKLLLDAANPHSQMSDELRKSCIKIVDPQISVPESYTTVYYDAWINDNQEDPILSLVYATIISKQSEFVPEKNRSLSNAAAAIATAISGRDVSTLLQQIKGSDKFENLRSSDEIHNLVKEFINQLIYEHGNRLVFFIDELDRCKPDYAIRFLERIKHYFDDDRITFVFAVSLSQLQWTVKSYYGSEFNSTRYLDKFFDFRISLRSIDHESFFSHQLDIGCNVIFSTVCVEASKYFSFSLREVERYGRMIKIAGSAISKYVGGFPEANATFFALNYIVPIILALQMYDINLYNRFMAGLNPNPMIDILLRPNVELRTHILCSKQEKYDSTNQVIDYNGGEKLIPLSDRLNEIYSAIFSKPYVRYCHIGIMTFDYSARHCIEEVASMLSPQSEYQFE